MKEEEKIKNLFVDYLKEQENKEYKTVDENVKSRSGNKDFDYLLKSDSDILIALEITQVNDKDFDISLYKSKIVRNFLEKLYLTDKNNLPGILVICPLSIDNERLTDRQLEKLLEKNTEYIKSKLIEVLSKKEVSFWIPEENYYPLKHRYFCHIQIEVKEEFNGINFFGDGREQFNNIDNEIEEILKKLRDLIPKKNKQLDYEADKRILLIQDTRTHKFNSTLKSALNIFASKNLNDMCNIDETFIVTSKNKKFVFQQAYKN